MRENTTSSITTIMDAKIERCVEPLFSKGGGGLKKKKKSKSNDDDDAAVEISDTAD